MKSKNYRALRSRINSFKFAYNGIYLLFKEETNAKIHLCCAVAMLLLGWFFKLSNIEWIIISFSIAFVLASELFNTAIEKLCDIYSLEKNEQIKVIKDMSAGAVLLAAVSAVISGIYIFLPKIFALC